MPTLNDSSQPAANKIPRAALVFIGILATLGFADAGFLTINRFSGSVPPCRGGFACETVLLSDYATLGGVPVALLGLAYYTLLLVCLLGYVDSGRIIFLRVLSVAVFFGLLASLYFTYLQIFVIQSLCLYCLVSGGICLLLAGTILFLLRFVRPAALPPTVP